MTGPRKSDASLCAPQRHRYSTRQQAENKSQSTQRSFISVLEERQARGQHEKMTVWTRTPTKPHVRVKTSVRRELTSLLWSAVTVWCVYCVWQYPGTDSWPCCCRAVPLRRPCPVTQLRAAPPLFRDVLIKKRGEPESHAACTDRDRDSVSQYLFRGCGAEPG